MLMGIHATCLRRLEGVSLPTNDMSKICWHKCQLTAATCLVEKLHTFKPAPLHHVQSFRLSIYRPYLNIKAIT